jgi:hypothetical protein
MLSSVLKIYWFAKTLWYNFILQALFQSAQHIYEKKEGSGSGRPNNMRILRIRFQIGIPNTAWHKSKGKNSQSWHSKTCDIRLQKEISSVVPGTKLN